jgi:hypothetical protein
MIKSLLARLTLWNSFKSVFSLAVLVLAIATTMRYPGAAHIYILFTIAFNALLFLGFREDRIFFDTFIGIFMWLGFWMKFSVAIVFVNVGFAEPVGNFDFSGAAFDHALLVSSCGAMALIAASFIRQRFFRYASAKPAKLFGALEAVYQRFRRRLWIAFFLVIILVAGSNIYLGIYQRGMVPKTVLPFGLSGFYTLLLLFGLASFSAVLLNFEFKVKSSPYVVALLCVMETFFSNASMLSRGMILNGTALFIGAAESAKGLGLRLSARFVIVIAGVFVALFLVSVSTANYLRAYAYSRADFQIASVVTSDDGGGGLGKNSLGQNIAETIPLAFFINRWIGVGGVMAVTSYDKLGWELWRNALAERYNRIGTSLYDRVIVAKDTAYLGSNMATKHFISLPGIIAFFYYPGSLVFLFAAMLGVGLLAACIEISVYKLGGGNVILCALLAQVIAGRYIHFGYVPYRSYLLLTGIYLVVFSLLVADKVLSAFFSNNGPDSARKS